MFHSFFRDQRALRSAIDRCARGRRGLTIAIAIAIAIVSLAGAAGITSLLWASGNALAQTPWPAKPLRFVVGYAPGGVADITARMIAQKLSMALGQQVIVDNRPSAGGIAAPARTPRPVIDRLNCEIIAAMALPDIRDKFQEFGIDARGGTPENLRALLVSEIAKWKQVVETSGIEKQ